MILLDTPYEHAGHGEGPEVCTHLAPTSLTHQPHAQPPSVVARLEYGHLADGLFVGCGEKPRAIRIVDRPKVTETGLQVVDGVSEMVEVTVREAETGYTDLGGDCSPSNVSAWLISAGHYEGTVV